MTPSTTPSRPRFEDLPLRAGDPKGSSWGLWGEDDELGTLNLLTPEVTRKAAAEVTTGEVVALKSDPPKYSSGYSAHSVLKSSFECLQSAHEPGAEALFPPYNCQRPCE